MNPHILMALDHLANPGKYTQVQLKDNALAAYAVAVADAVAATDATIAATDAAAANALADAYYYYDDDEGDVEYWLNEYFLRSGENKQDYITELNK
jgi:hypothetical protein